VRLRVKSWFGKMKDELLLSDEVSRGAFPSWNRSILAEIYLCHACAYHEIEDGNGAPGVGGCHGVAAGRRLPGVVERCRRQDLRLPEIPDHLAHISAGELESGHALPALLGQLLQAARGVGQLCARSWGAVKSHAGKRGVSMSMRPDLPEM
jgi:hypothetical protein